MAVQIVELIRVRRGPSLAEGLQLELRNVPRGFWGSVLSCKPAAMRTIQHGTRPVTECLGQETDTSGRKAKRVDILTTPVVYAVSAPAIARARRNYLQWRLALFELRMSFQIPNNLSRWAVTDAMPPQRPWQKDVDE